MNYIEMINNFWRVDAEYSFTGNETKLYMFLLHTSNRLGWKNPFRLSYRQIELGSTLTVNTVVSARNKLSEAGLISFEVGKKGCPRSIINKTVYEIRVSKIDNHPDNLSDNHPGNPLGNHPEDVNKQETGNLNLNNLSPSVPPGEVKGERGEEVFPDPIVKKGKEKNCAKKESPPLVFPFASERFMTVWGALADSPKWRDRPAHALQTALNQLGRFEEDFAVWLVESATVNNWQGVVFSDTAGNYRKWKSGGTRSGQLNVANHDNSKVYENF